MTNNPTIDGVSRRLLELSAQCLSNSGYEMAHAELRALLAAPVVERQEPFAYAFRWDYDHGNGLCRNALRFVEDMTHVDHEDKSTWREIQPLYTAPPQLAELQAENERLSRQCANSDLALSTQTRNKDRYKQRAMSADKERDELQATIERQAEIAGLKADADRYRKLQKLSPYRFKKMQDASTTDGGDVFYFHRDRFDARLDATAALNGDNHER